MAVYDISGKVIESEKTSRYAGKKLSIIGDSIDTFNQSGYKIDGYAMWYPRDGITNVEQTWWKKVINASGMTLEVNASFSGSRVTDTAPDSSFPDFYDRVSLIGNPDVIFVTLGTNDSNNDVDLGEYDFNTIYTSLSESTFRTAYIKGLKALQATYPNAQITCISEKMKDAYKESIVHIADVLGVSFIDASDYVGANGSHPGEYGMRQIASTVLYPTDMTFTQNKIPADSKAVRDELVGKGLSQDIKEALLACFRDVAWLNWAESGLSSYEALYLALNGGVDPRIAYEIPHGTDISTWSIDTGQHAYTLDEDFTILIKSSVDMSSKESGAFILDSLSRTGSTVGCRLQVGLSNGAVNFTASFNGGLISSGIGGTTSNTFSKSNSHDVIFIMVNNGKNMALKVYVDGNIEYQDARLLQNKEGATYPPTYYVGKHHGDYEAPWPGVVDVFRIYNIALSDDEINRILGLV